MVATSQDAETASNLPDRNPLTRKHLQIGTVFHGQGNAILADPGYRTTWGASGFGSESLENYATLVKRLTPSGNETLEIGDGVVLKTRGRPMLFVRYAGQ